MAVVFTDLFTVGSDVDLVTHNADYIEIATSGHGALRVNAAEDAVENRYSGIYSTPFHATHRWAGSGAPTGSQQVTFNASRVSGNGSTTAVMLRMPTANTNNGYVCGLGNSYANGIAIWRRVAGVDTLLANGGTPASPDTLVAEATGTTTVALSLSDGTTTITYDDSSGSRHEVGTPGIYVRQGSDSTASSAFLYDFVVDDLASGGYTLVAEAGSYSLTGLDAALRAARRLALDAGSYALLGQDATLRRGRTLTAAAGAYALTGQDVTLRATRVMIAAVGAYQLTGQAAGLVRGRLLVADRGTYLLTGQGATLRATRLLVAAPGVYVLTGIAATLDYSGFVLVRARGTDLSRALILAVGYALPLISARNLSRPQVAATHTAPEDLST